MLATTLREYLLSGLKRGMPWRVFAFDNQWQRLEKKISKTGKNIEKHEKYQTHEKTSKLSKYYLNTNI